MNAIEWIKNQKRSGKNWDWIATVGNKNESELSEFLNVSHEYHGWEHLTPTEWRNLVDAQQREWEDDERIRDEKGHTIIVNTRENNGIEAVPTNVDSNWQTYKGVLQQKGFSTSSIKNIEEETFDTLKCLSRNTIEKDPIKGIVIGNVQSGKTANMAALIAMAADYGWNMFIILSGMHSGLRNQTAKRLYYDLDNRENRFYWVNLNNPSLRSPYDEQIERLHLGENDLQRYIAVLLKNKDWLKNFIPWIERTPDKTRNLRLLIIDDESDQASINTNAGSQDAQETAINDKIKKLLAGENIRGKKACDFGAVNYICYTATPYANILNETDGNSLYPKNFMTTLSVSNEYFGPQQIFGDGIKFNGLDIIRIIPNEDNNNEVQEIANIQNGNTNITMMPTSLEDALIWFICSTACLRFRDHAKPVSMLIHTSMKTEAHSRIAALVNWWFQSTTKEDIIKKCLKVWDQETQEFTQGDFKRQYPLYGDGQLSIMDYPTFDTIKPYIEELLSSGLTTIKTDPNDEFNRIYSKGIHLCINNSDRQNEASRLFYPEDSETLNTTPAFIVIGGNTLSRGLTIEGLVSTYFLRPTKSGDTLMQMGRWFGYRQGYELLPRIWMTQSTKDNFRYLSDADLDLREQIRDMAHSGANFEEVAPSILNSPAASTFRLLANNRMAAAVETDFDFSGTLYETLSFENDEDKLNMNLEATKKFINSLGNPDKTPHVHNNYHHVWRNIPLKTITDYIEEYELSSRDKKFEKMHTMISWLEKVTTENELGDWNVVLAGNQNGNTKWEPSDEVSIYIRSHGSSIDSKERISFKALRSPKDVFSDIVSNDEFKLEKPTPSNSDIFKIRSDNGLEKTPLLIINIINKDSEAQGKSLYPFNAKQHLAGFTIYIPGHKEGRLARRITVNLPGSGYDIED